MIKTQHCPNCEATEQKLNDFKQEVSDAVSALLDRFLGDNLSQSIINGHLHQFIIPAPKPDPLVEVLLDMELSHDQEQGQHDARYLRAKLEALGLEIVPCK
jgi:DNA-binding transcriptional ArsR family regulator